ncbi:MAG: glycerophosphodiester phosphodiesterase [Alphaproteobacteria bacterium]
MFDLLASRSGTVRACGHRGHAIAAPENTMAAFRLAKEHGAESCEIDIVLSSDNEIVVLHDITVDRTTNGHGYARDLTAQQITNFDAGAYFDPKFAGERVPLLREVLTFAKDEQVGFHIELKDYEHNGPMFDRLAALLDETGAMDWVVVISFDHPQLLKAKQHIPGLRTEGITHARHCDPADLARRAQLDSVSIEARSFHPDDARALHDAGVAIRCHVPVPEKIAFHEGYGRKIRDQVGQWLGDGLIDSLSGDDVAYLSALINDYPLKRAA